MAEKKQGKQQNSFSRKFCFGLACLLLLSLAFAVFTGCKSDDPPKDDVKDEVQTSSEEKATSKSEEEKPAAKEESKDKSEEKSEKPSEKADDKTEKSEAAKTEEPKDQGPDVKKIRKALEEEGFKFWVNNMLKDPEPQEVIYADKEVGKAELTVLYGVFKDAEEADLAIKKLLESDMIGKAISFGAKLEQPHDKVDSKQYFVSLNSFLATARAELRQEGERIGVVILYKKNKEVVFEPYFELMELPEP